MWPPPRIAAVTPPTITRAIANTTITATSFPRGLSPDEGGGGTERIPTGKLVTVVACGTSCVPQSGQYKSADSARYLLHLGQNGNDSGIPGYLEYNAIQEQPVFTQVDLQNRQ